MTLLFHWFETYRYFSWLCIFVFIPTTLLWSLYYKRLTRYAKLYVVLSICAVVWAISLDLVSSDWLGIWLFQSHYLFTIVHIPFEEFLFILLLPQELISILLLFCLPDYGKV